MPTFAYICDECGNRYEEFVSSYVDKRRSFPCAVCGHAMRENFMANRPYADCFVPHHDEALGCDIHGRREKAQILRAEGLQEVGDRVGGARDFDEKAPHHVGTSAPKGIRHSDLVRDREQGREQDSNWNVITEDKSGRQRTVNTADLRGPVR